MRDESTNESVSLHCDGCKFSAEFETLEEILQVGNFAVWGFTLSVHCTLGEGKGFGLMMIMLYLQLSSK